MYYTNDTYWLQIHCPVLSAIILGTLSGAYRQSALASVAAPHPKLGPIRSRGEVEGFFTPLALQGH